MSQLAELRPLTPQQTAGRTHPSAVIDGVVDLGACTEVGALAYLTGHVIVGERTKIYPHVVIGTDGEHRTAKSVGAIRIGSDTIVREFCCIQRGTGERETTIGDRVMLMDRVHVAHDVVVEDDVTVSPGAVFGGHTRIHKGATIGIGAMTHQHVTIGAYAMVGMGAVVLDDVEPFAMVVGNPARKIGPNRRGVEAFGAKLGLFWLDSEEYRALLDAWGRDAGRRRK